MPPSARAQSGLPQNLPVGLPDDLLLAPWDAGYVWVERWGSNEAWLDGNMWRTGQQVGSHPDVDFDNTVLINNREIYRNQLQNIPNGPGVPDVSGASLWVGTAEPDATSGNDNIDVFGTFTIGELSVQNVSLGAGRSFRNGGTVVFDSGDPDRNARIVHLGDESSNGVDLNIRGGTNFQLDSNTELYLLVTGGEGPRFRIRDASQITGTGDLILNPGDAFNYTGEATGQGPEIRRELRIDDFGQIATSGRIEIGAARIRITDFGEIVNTSGITINEQGQLRFERVGEQFYNLNSSGGAVITLNSHGHLMDDNNRGAIRQQAEELGDIANISNDISLAGDSSMHAVGEGVLRVLGDISGPGQLVKTGEGGLELLGDVQAGGGMRIDGGSVLVENQITGGVELNEGRYSLGGAATQILVITLNPDYDRFSGIGEVILDGTFSFDLDQAGLVVGTVWDVVGSGLDVEYGEFFAVAGFTQTGDGIWTSNNPHYQFSQLTGQLSVIPEPGSALLLLLGTGWLAFSRRLARSRNSYIMRPNS